MVQMTTFQDLLGSIMDRGQRLIETFSSESQDTPLVDLCQALVSTRGEASGVALAGRILRGYQKLTAEEKLVFFHDLAEKYDVDSEKVLATAKEFNEVNSSETLADLMAAVEPQRQQLFRRLNLAPGGTSALVSLRSDLLQAIKHTPTLKRVDLDFSHLFVSWFNRGFLMLRHIDWSTSADLLEKIIQYEAVHEIGSWRELRRRLKPTDRRCFAFFHPSMPDEPLIFVQVALAKEIPDSISSVLQAEREKIQAQDASTAVFYSISNCQDGLRGVSFGSFLIKQVAHELSRELPDLKTFVTLSPVPGFMSWLRRQAESKSNKKITEVYSLVEKSDWVVDSDIVDQLAEELPGLVAYYLTLAKRSDGWPLDPVARFHLGNGAILHRINWLADSSPRGLKTAAGIMVNYRYDLSRLEDNHEAYAIRKEVNFSRTVRDQVSQNKNYWLGTGIK